MHMNVIERLIQKAQRLLPPDNKPDFLLPSSSAQLNNFWLIGEEYHPKVVDFLKTHIDSFPTIGWSSTFESWADAEDTYISLARNFREEITQLMIDDLGAVHEEEWIIATHVNPTASFFYRMIYGLSQESLRRELPLFQEAI